MREYLYSEEVLDKDESTEPEVSPSDAHTFSGMGSSSSSSANKGGKYEGFGNSPIARENLGDKVLDLLESAMAHTDGKDEVMKICLTSSTGDYQPVIVSLPEPAPPTDEPVKRSSASTSSSVVQPKPKAHVKGKAGGGWDSEDSDTAADQLEFITKLASLSTTSQLETEETSEK